MKDAKVLNEYLKKFNEPKAQFQCRPFGFEWCQGVDLGPEYAGTGPIDFIKWAEGKTSIQAWDECPCGTWLLCWAQLESVNFRDLMKVKGACVKILYEMLGDDGRKAVDLAVAFADGLATLEELDYAMAKARVDTSFLEKNCDYSYGSLALWHAALAASAATSLEAVTAAIDASAFNAIHEEERHYFESYRNSPEIIAITRRKSDFAVTKMQKETAEIVRSIIKPTFL